MAEILADLVRMEGLDLSQMQSQFTELAQHVKEWSRFASRFDEFLTQLNRHTEAIEMLTGERTAASSPETQFEETRDISLDMAKEEVLQLFRKNSVEHF